MDNSEMLRVCIDTPEMHMQLPRHTPRWWCMCKLVKPNSVGHVLVVMDGLQHWTDMSKVRKEILRHNPGNMVVIN